MTILTKRVLVYIEIVEISCPSPECIMYNLLLNGGDLCCGVSLSISLFVIVVGKLQCREGIQKEPL
jgi:hypothetical protein